MTSIAILQGKLGYSFKDTQLLTQSLCHRSAGTPNNERLEYLGDSIIGFYIAQFLYHKFQDLSEGKLTRLRASLVNKTTLAGLARELSLGDYLKMGQGEYKSGGYNGDSVLSDALEAVVGAVYLDGGMESVEIVLDRIYQQLKDSTGPELVKDNKTRLQEYLQSIDGSLPVYELIDQQGEPHDLVFTVSCQIEGKKENFIGTAKSRKIAEQNAAAKALEILLS